MPKPRCTYYPNETARRHCPAIKGPISARACSEKFLVEIQCDPACPFLAQNLTYEHERLLRAFRSRLAADYVYPPDWISHDDVIIPVLHIESILARFAQWYPSMTDAEALEVLDDLEVQWRSESNRLEIRSRYTSGRGKEIQDVLRARLTAVIDHLRPSQAGVALYDRLHPAVEVVRGSLQRMNTGDGGGYLRHLISFALKVEPRPVSSRLILP